MMFLVQTLGDTMTGESIKLLGSGFMFGLVILCLLLALMLFMAIPVPFIVGAMSIIGVLMGSVVDDPGLKIIKTVCIIILGAMVGLMILRFFNNSTSQ